MLLTPNQIELFRKAIKEGLIKVLIFDLETSPSQFWGWGTGEQYVAYSQLVKGTETKIITAQYKYALVDKKSKYLVWDKTSKGHDDSVMVEEITKLINTADIVIGQNSKQFDIKVLQERAKILRLPPVSVDFMIDTLTSSRSSFRALSHKLDYRSKQFGLGGKNKMEMADWIDILEGRVSPEKKMIPYGLKDTDDTEMLFWKELPYYNLPKSTINKILKLIIKPEQSIVKKSGLFCKDCAKRRQRRFDIGTVPGINEAICNNCKGFNIGEL
jgi:hypothetical protein